MVFVSNVNVRRKIKKQAQPKTANLNIKQHHNLLPFLLRVLIQHKMQKIHKTTQTLFELISCFVVNQFKVNHKLINTSTIILCTFDVLSFLCFLISLLFFYTIHSHFYVIWVLISTKNHFNNHSLLTCTHYLFCID